MEVNIDNLTPEQLKHLEAQIENKRKAEQARVQNEREAYKQLVDGTVRSCVKKLELLSAQMMQVKKEIFEEFGCVIKTKNELFDTKANRQSDTFTTSDSSMSITLGNRVNEGWDDTVENGIEKVKEYLATLAKDENSAALVETVMGLLAKDRKGALKANKVLELEKLAIKSQNEDFIDGINIIKNAYRPVPTCQFIQVTLKNEKGEQYNLPLSLSAM